MPLVPLAVSAVLAVPFGIDAPAVPRAQEPEPGRAPPVADAWQPLFDGRTLAGWRGDPGVWSVREGCIEGSTAGGAVAANTYLVREGEVGDFELEFEVRLEGDNNSGVQYRSRVLDGEGFRVAGYQCDVHADPRYFGMLYEERGRGIVATHGQRVACGEDGAVRVLARGPAPERVDLREWHRMRIVARGPRLQHWVDGRLAVEVDDGSRAAVRRGVLALQVHAGAPMTVWFRGLRLRRLQGPAEAPGAAPEREAQQAGAPTPQWIWDAAAADGEEVFFRRAFELPEVPSGAQLAVTCDNHCRVYVNGERVTQSDRWEAPHVVDVRAVLRAGVNVIAVHGWNDAGPAGLCARLSWHSAAGGGHVVTDRSWRCSADDPDGWDAAGFERPDAPGAGWPAATELAPLGGGPWAGQLPADAFDDLLLGAGPQPPREAPELSVPEGLAAERLLAVPRSMGSWVCLASHPDGHLFASDQRRGLYRIAPAGVGGAAATAVERLELDLPGCQGLCWAFGALYAVANGGASGLYRLCDGDGDGRPDEVELLRRLEGSGEHGPHAVVLAPGARHLLVLCGNHTRVPELARSRLPQNWGEDQLLPRLDDPNGHAVGVMAPGGFLCRVDPDGREWELWCAGFRNAYDVAVHPGTGELFAFDADMEWDMGLPWYRPTRILHCVSGADFGWRHGSGKWAADLPDTLPAVADVGPASPTGVLFAPRGMGGEEVLLAADWTFGTVWALDLQPQGASFTAAPRAFAQALPLPVTDAVEGADGRLYVLTGGRGLPSRLYRIALADGPGSDGAGRWGGDAAAAAARALRAELERFHGVRDAAAVDRAWPHLGSDDAFVRHAARTAVESQPVATWAARALAAPGRAPAWTALTALVALARQGEPGHLGPLLEAAARIDLAPLDGAQALAFARVHALAFARLGAPPPAAGRRLAARLLERFACGDARLDRELCALLAFLDAPGLLDRALPLLAPLRPAAPPPWADVAGRNAAYGTAIARMLAAMPPLLQLGIADALRAVRHGWTLEQREQWFQFLAAARRQRGGASYDGYLTAMVDAAWAGCTPAEQQALAAVAEKARAEPPPFRARPPVGPGRDWRLAEAAALARAGLRARDHDAGRNLFHAIGCASCHRFAGEGGAHGPDLTGLGNRFGAADVLEAILEPGAVVSDQYAGAVLRRRDGTSVFGRVQKGVKDGAEVFTVVPAAATARPFEVPAAEVLAVEPSRLSPMPADLVDALGEEELLDLLAFLLSRGDPAGPMFAR